MLNMRRAPRDVNPSSLVATAWRALELWRLSPEGRDVQADGLRRAIAEVCPRYTRMVNFREGWRGHRWARRFASFVLDERHRQTVPGLLLPVSHDHHRCYFEIPTCTVVDSGAKLATDEEPEPPPNDGQKLKRYCESARTVDGSSTEGTVTVTVFP